MYNILTLNKISKTGLNKLTYNYTYGDNIENPEGILLRSFKMHDMELPESLLAVARCGAGVNNIPLDKCADKGIVVFNTPGANANAVKELVLTALLISSRNIIGGYNWVQGLDGDVAAKVEKGKAQFAGPEIMGKKLGVIGLGAIGVLAANSAEALGMEVLGYDPYLLTKSSWNIDSSVKCVSLDKLLAESDYITIHVPYMPATKGMIGKDALSKVKDGVRIINLARGELANNDAVKKALASGKVSCYVTDFPNDEMTGVENVITLPHLGASTPEAEDNCAVMAAYEIMDYLENGNITHSVNYPDVSIDAPGKTKICILAKGAAADKIISTAAAANVTESASKTKGEYSYTILAAEGDADKAAESVKVVDGIIKVRVIK
ncbi:MAG: 3-phosphoglycerate dehydrogenase family protein [Clostridiales bacterium]|nr:3-phosphoglycerate dehydrogenase family protein [Clostridiales bacterium]